MAYSTGSFTDRFDLLNKMRSFLLANGFTVYTTSTNALTDGILYFNKDVLYITMALATATRDPSGSYPNETDNMIVFNQVPSAPNPAQSYHNQTGSILSGDVPSNRGEIRRIVNGSTYYFFSDGDYFYMSLSSGNGYYTHGLFCVLDKTDTYTGGALSLGSKNTWWYVSGIMSGYGNEDILSTQSQNCGFFYINESGIDADSMHFYNPIADSASFTNPQFAAWYAARTTGACWGDHLLQVGQRAVDGKNVMKKLPLFMKPNSSQIFLLGSLPDVRLIGLENLTPEDEITLGADTWKVFPTFRKSFPLRSGLPTESDYNLYGGSSGYHGFAIKKVV